MCGYEEPSERLAGVEDLAERVFDGEGFGEEGELEAVGGDCEYA